MNAMAAGFGAAAAACNVRLCLSCFQGFGGIPGNAASDDNRHAIQIMRTRMPKPGARGQRSHTGRLQEGAALRANVSKVHSLDSQHTKRESPGYLEGCNLETTGRSGCGCCRCSEANGFGSVLVKAAKSQNRWMRVNAGTSPRWGMGLSGFLPDRELIHGWS
jgi:hypothetical protein